MSVYVYSRWKSKQHLVGRYFPPSLNNKTPNFYFYKILVNLEREF